MDIPLTLVNWNQNHMGIGTFSCSRSKTTFILALTNVINYRLHFRYIFFHQFLGNFNFTSGLFYACSYWKLCLNIKITVIGRRNKGNSKSQCNKAGENQKEKSKHNYKGFIIQCKIKCLVVKVFNFLHCKVKLAGLSTNFWTIVL